jgi:dimethyladenosine transferase (EC 2.1.1.-)
VKQIVAPHRARKRFGQHFLVDASYIARIVAAIDLQPGDCLLEIGPGQAALTRALLGRVDHLDAIEIDRDLCARLRAEFNASRLSLHEGDALRFDYAALAQTRGRRLRIVGNLPYNISTPLLFRLAEAERDWQDAVFMLQQEVVERMAAREGEAARGRLSVMLQYRFAVEPLFTVPPGAFRPVPAVHSAVVRLRPLGAARLCPRQEALFAELVTAAFSQRRKMIRKSLEHWLTAAEIAELGIDPQARAETLTCADFVRLSDAVSDVL